ncbi:MAG TPA: hypothetical protein VJH55_00145 [Candidatus Paceibacterota bacterium]
MKIYISHSRGQFDYKNGLYLPLRQSKLNSEYEIMFPHETSDEPFDSFPLLDSLGLFGAEVSFPSTGLGIELGRASMKKVPIVCFHMAGCVPARSVRNVTEHVYQYRCTDDLIRVLTAHIGVFCK